MNNPFKRKGILEEYGLFYNRDNPTAEPTPPTDDPEKKSWKEYIPNLDDIKAKVGKIKNKFKRESNSVNLDDLEATITDNSKLFTEALAGMYEKGFNTKNQKPAPWNPDDPLKKQYLDSIAPFAFGSAAVVAKIAARSALLKGSKAALAYATGGSSVLIAGGAGAVTGGVYSAGKMYLQERARINSLGSRLEQLGKDYDAFHEDYHNQGPVEAIKKYVGMQGTLARAEKTATTDEDKAKVADLKQKLEQLDLTTQLHKDKWQNESDKNKRLYKFIRARSELERDQLAADPKLRKILQKIEKKHGSKDKKRGIIKAASMGSLIGGVTGLAGAGIAEAVHNIAFGGSTVKEAVSAINEHAKDSIGNVSEHAKEAAKTVKETAKNFIGDQKITFHKGDTLWGAVKQWNLDHGVSPDKLTNKMIMEQVKHAALKNGIDVVAWKDALDGTGMPDIKIPIGHEVILDSGLADIGDHFGVHIADHSAGAVSEAVNAGHNIIADSVNHTQAAQEHHFHFSTGEKVALGTSLGILAGSAVVYFNRDRIQDYINKRKSRNNSRQSTTPLGMPSGPDATTTDNGSGDIVELDNLAAEKQIPQAGIEYFNNLLKSDGLLNRAEKQHGLDVSVSQFIHDSLLSVQNFSSPNQEDLNCIADAITAIRKHKPTLSNSDYLDELEKTILDINPGLKDQIINILEGVAVNNPPTPDFDQSQENETEIEALMSGWTTDKQEIEDRILDLKNNFEESELAMLKATIANKFPSGKFYTDQSLPHIDNLSPEQKARIETLETEIENTVKGWSKKIDEIEKAATPNWRNKLETEAKSLNIPDEGIESFILLMDEKGGPVTKAFTIGALSEDEILTLRGYIRAQQDYSNNPPEMSNIDNVFKFLITLQSEAHGPGNKPDKLDEYKAIGKIIDLFQTLNPTLLKNTDESLREKYMPEDQFVEYALNKWTNFPKTMKDETTRRAWVRLSKKNGLFESAIKEQITTDAQLKKIKEALEMSAVDKNKLSENIINPLKNIRIKIIQRFGSSSEKLEILNKLEEQLNLACPELKTKNP